jgi:hypothetical protein
VTSTDLTTAGDGGQGRYLALDRSSDEIAEMIGDTLAGQDIDGFDLPRLTVPAGGATIWQLDDPVHGTQDIRELRGVVVHTSQTRSWWPQSLEESQDSSTPPSCSSPDAKVGYGQQWATAENPKPEGEPRRLECSSCPHSQWGSGRNGGQACSLKSQWFFLREGSFLPIVVVLPAMSLKPARRYLLGLIGAGLHPSSVETVLTLKQEKKGANRYGVVTPTMGEKLDPETAKRARAYAELLKPLFDRQSAPDGDVIDVEPEEQAA